MVKLAVVTHTRGEHHQWLETCFSSVKNNLPKNAEHFIIKCYQSKELNQARWDALSLADYICFVDDDDVIVNNSLNLCLDALEQNKNVGIAFTNERRTDANGTIISEKDRSVSYDQVYENPQSIHHLCMIRTSLVQLEIKRISDALGIGIEWLIKGGTALTSGAIHVPIQGYEWRCHSSQHSETREWIETYRSKFHFLQAYLKAQAKFSGPIPKLEM